MPTRLEQLTEMHAADPADADLPYMIALEHAKAEDHAAAIDWLDRTLALSPSYHYAYFQKVKALSALGEDEDALAALDVGVARATADGNAKAVGELEELRQALA